MSASWSHRGSTPGTWLFLGCLLGCAPSDERDEKHWAQRALESGSPGRDFEAFLRRSTLESELFRRSLFEASDGGAPRAELLARAVVRFRDSAASHLVGRRSTSAFTQGERELVDWMAGRRGRLSGRQVYGGFRGRWYGLWESMQVDHHWGPFVSYDEPRRYALEGGDVYLRGYQFAWVGDGYGLNHVATVDPGENGGDYLLGYVVHVKDGDLGRETARRPHVGIPAGEGKIIWLTAGEAFLEESFRTEEGEEAYAITGFFYRLENGILRTIRGFQAIYSRAPQRRLPWHGWD